MTADKSQQALFCERETIPPTFGSYTRQDITWKVRADGEGGHRVDGQQSHHLIALGKKHQAPWAWPTQQAPRCVTSHEPQTGVTNLCMQSTLAASSWKLNLQNVSEKTGLARKPPTSVSLHVPNRCAPNSNSRCTWRKYSLSIYIIHFNNHEHLNPQLELATA